MKQTELISRIRELRTDAGYTQIEVSSKLNIQRQTYCNYESGLRMPPLEIIVALADLYGVTVDSLIRGTATPAKAPADPLAALPKAARRLLADFFALPEDMQREILEFVHFKKQLFKRRGK